MLGHLLLCFEWNVSNIHMQVLVCVYALNCPLPACLIAFRPCFGAGAIMRIGGAAASFYVCCHAETQKRKDTSLIESGLRRKLRSIVPGWSMQCIEFMDVTVNRPEQRMVSQGATQKHRDQHRLMQENNSITDDTFVRSRLLA
jgi:hypothetical protein